MKIGIIGSGGVGQILAGGLVAHGHDVRVGTRDPDGKRATFADTGADVVAVEDAAAFGDIVILAVHGSASVDVVRAQREHLQGKVVIDTTNPLGPASPGAHKPHGMADSLIQRHQAAAPSARFVKAWNCTPGPMMIDPPFTGTQFICGDDEDAKQAVAKLLAEIGWDTIDIGGADTGPYVEGMALAVINHGLRSGDWAWGLRLMHAPSEPAR